MLFWGLALGWLSLAMGALLYWLIRRWWRAWRYGAPVDHASLLVEYGRKMTSGALDREALARLLTADIPRTLGVERAALLLPEDHTLVATAENELRLPISHAAVRWAASAGEAQRADRGRLHELVQGRDGLDWTAVWAPLMRGIELRGLWLLGARAGGRPYAPADLAWLTALGRQAAIVLEALHYAEQERLAATEIRALYQQVVVAREIERGRLSRELHDGVLQDLCAVTRDLKAMETQRGEQQPLFDDLAARSGETVHTLRAICNDLRPPLLQQDLSAALRALVEELDRRSTAAISIEISAQDLRLPDDAALAVFRITQEALNNAVQHADASEIAVRLTEYPDRLRLTVTDDGRGIIGRVDAARGDAGRFVAQGHFGLAGMRERAAMIGGALDVQTVPDYGTVVILELPR